MLADAERIELWRAVAGAVDVPVIAATGTNDTAHSVTLTRQAATRPARRASWWSRPTTTGPRRPGLSAHFRAVAAATDLPVMLYDIPVRPGRRIGRALTIELAREVPNIVAVKDATGDPAAAAASWPRAPTASRSTAATTPSPCRSWPWAAPGS